MGLPVRFIAAGVQRQSRGDLADLFDKRPAQPPIKLHRLVYLPRDGSRSASNGLLSFLSKSNTSPMTVELPLAGLATLSGEILSAF